MSQLKMYRVSAPVPPAELPEGFTLRRFDRSRYDEEVEAWLTICREGLVAPDAGREAFEDACVNYPDARPENIFFICRGGEPVATVLAVVHEKEDGPHGYVHMVCCRACCRGLGLGRQLNRIVLGELEAAGCPDSYLTTDDFRLGAIKGYLEAGFLPVLHKEDMRPRWEKVLAALGIAESAAVDGDWNPLPPVRAACD